MVEKFSKIIKENIRNENGFSTIQGAYFLIFTLILFVTIVSLGSFFYQKHVLQNNVNTMVLQIADLHLNTHMSCNKAKNTVLDSFRKNSKTSIAIKVNKITCENTWVQIEGVKNIHVLQIPVTISTVSRAGYE